MTFKDNTTENYDLVIGADGLHSTTRDFAFGKEGYDRIDLGWETNKLLQYMEESNDFYFDVAIQIKMKSWTKGRIALVGDSGFCSTALSGQGTTTALVGAYILAGELKAASGNYIVAFERYNMLLHPFVEANQELGAWINETFLLEGAVSKEAVEARTDNIIKKISAISNVIKLPEYSAYK